MDGKILKIYHQSLERELEESEITQLQAWATEYPYFALPPAIIARATKASQPNESNLNLTAAAARYTSRNLLQAFIEAASVEQKANALPSNGKKVTREKEPISTAKRIVTPTKSKRSHKAIENSPETKLSSRKKPKSAQKVIPTAQNEEPGSDSTSQESKSKLAVEKKDGRSEAGDTSSKLEKVEVKPKNPGKDKNKGKKKGKSGLDFLEQKNDSIEEKEDSPQILVKSETERESILAAGPASGGANQVFQELIAKDSGINWFVNTKINIRLSQFEWRKNAIRQELKTFAAKASQEGPVVAIAVPAVDPAKAKVPSAKKPSKSSRRNKPLKSAAPLPKKEESHIQPEVAVDPAKSKRTTARKTTRQKENATRSSKNDAAITKASSEKEKVTRSSKNDAGKAKASSKKDKVNRSPRKETPKAKIAQEKDKVNRSPRRETPKAITAQEKDKVNRSPRRETPKAITAQEKDKVNRSPRKETPKAKTAQEKDKVNRSSNKETPKAKPTSKKEIGAPSPTKEAGKAKAVPKAKRRSKSKSRNRSAKKVQEEFLPEKIELDFSPVPETENRTFEPDNAPPSGDDLQTEYTIGTFSGFNFLGEEPTETSNSESKEATTDPGNSEGLVIEESNRILEISITPEQRAKYFKNKEVDPKDSSNPSPSEEIIEKFIEEEPSISSPVDYEIKDAELGKNSLVEDEELVSETLALIHAEQGNKKKAIKIYDKLSLLFPDKKSYFADQILKLKKK